VRRALPATLPLYAGGFLGPFGGGILAPLIPSVAAGLHTSQALVAGAITAYMVPFAGLQLVSGTIAERLGGGLVVRAGYVAFGGAAVLCAFPPDAWAFVGARALAGAANAFLSPILLAALSESVAPEVLGRSVGTFAAVQAAGVAFAPVLGGALGEVSWRLAFLLVAAVSAGLAVPRVGLRPRRRDAPAATLRSLWSRWIGLVAAAGAAGYLGFTSLGFVVALVCAREFRLGSAATGLVVAAYGLGGIALGRAGGRAADRIGRPQTALLGGAACCASVLALAFVPTAWGFGLVFLLVGFAGAFAWAGLNTVAVESFPQNRAGAVSAFSAFKFFGLALAPVVYLPLLDEDTRLPFLVAAGFSAAFALLVLPWFRRYASAG
jgi:MFS family permease